VLARAAATAAPDGTATSTLIGTLTTAQPVTVTAIAPGHICRAILTPTRAQPTLTCHTR